MPDDSTLALSPIRRESIGIVTVSTFAQVYRLCRLNFHNLAVDAVNAKSDLSAVPNCESAGFVFVQVAKFLQNQQWLWRDGVAPRLNISHNLDRFFRYAQIEQNLALAIPVWLVLGEEEFRILAIG